MILSSHIQVGGLVIFTGAFAVWAPGRGLGTFIGIAAYAALPFNGGISFEHHLLFPQFQQFAEPLTVLRLYFGNLGKQDGGWLLVRFSGTEPLIRVYCETTHEDKVQAILDAGLEIAGIA